MLAGLVIAFVCVAFTVWLFYPVSEEGVKQLAEWEAEMKKLEDAIEAKNREPRKTYSNSTRRPPRTNNIVEDCFEIADDVLGDD